MMICKNCGKEFDGKFCPECGTKVEEELTQCPNCGSERIDNGKFCVNCGYNFIDPIQPIVENKPSPSKDNSKKFLNIFAKVYRWLLASGMLFLGIVSLLCLTAPVITESFLGESVPLCTGFEALSGKGDAPTSIVNSSIMLLVISLLCIIYGGVQLYFAFKKPYIGIKKYVLWGIDGGISIILLVLGCIVGVEANSEQLMDGSLGSGFAMCMVMGIFGLICLGARIYYELKVFDFEDTGLTHEQIEKSKERKPIDKAKVKKLALRIGVPVLVVAVLLAVIIPTVAWATNIFRAGKVDKINIGDSQEQVVKVLGEPYEKNDYRYEYYSDEYIEIDKKGEKLSQDPLGNLEQLIALEEQLNKLVYQYICVEFDSEGKVTSVFLDAEKCNSKEDKKAVKSYKFVNKEIMRYCATDIIFSTKYTDKSFYKGIAKKNYISFETSIDEVSWTDNYGNEYIKDINVKDNPNLKLRGIIFDDSYFEIDEKYILTLYSIDMATDGEEKFSNFSLNIKENINKIVVDEKNDIYVAEGNCIIRKADRTLMLGCNNSVIPDNIASIGKNAFSYCSKLTNLVIPSGVMKIGDDAFYRCNNLTSIEIPNSVTSIGSYAFSGCRNLSRINMSSGLTSMGEYVFSGCSSLTSISIPNGVTKIDDYVFSGCSRLTSIEIPRSITSIGISAFSYCNNLTSIEIPNSVTSIKDSAFWGCSKLTINCEIDKKPIGWDEKWNYNCPVVWGYKG